MNSKAVNFIKNFSYTLTSNLVTLFVSTMVTLIVPKLIGVEEYGYWQLYLFYSSYVGFMHFGWNDGIYLRYGGLDYKELDRGIFYSQFIMLFVFQLVILVMVLVSADSILINDNRSFIIKLTALNMFIVNIRLMLLYILQATNKIKKYAQITLLDRILYCILIALLIIFGINNYKLLIITDLVSKTISLIYALYCCRDFTLYKFSKFKFGFLETKKNISTGIKLMFSNIASMLIIGVIRFGIERSWNVSTFGKVSLTLSISSLMMIFVNAISIVLFPVLRKIDNKHLSNTYVYIRDLLMILLLGGLILYYPLKAILSSWLPNYADSFYYMSMLFPMVIFEGKMSLLINTFLKTLRKEKLMMKINLISLSLSLLLTVFSTIIIRNLDFAILSIIIILAFRSVLAEIFVAKILQVVIIKDVVLEIILNIAFVIFALFFNSWSAVLLYLLFYGLYLLIKRDDISSLIRNGKKFFGSSKI